jgi:hypothetical protein
LIILIVLGEEYKSRISPLWSFFNLLALHRPSVEIFSSAPCTLFSVCSSLKVGDQVAHSGWILPPSSCGTHSVGPIDRASFNNTLFVQRLVLSIGNNWVGSTWRRRQNPVSESKIQDDGYCSELRQLCGNVI